MIWFALLSSMSSVATNDSNSGPTALPDYVVKVTSAIKRSDSKPLDDSYGIQEVTDHTENRSGEFLVTLLSNCTQKRVFGGKDGIYVAQYQCVTAQAGGAGSRCVSLLISEALIRKLGCTPVVPPIPVSKQERGN